MKVKLSSYYYCSSPELVRPHFQILLYNRNQRFDIATLKMAISLKNLFFKLLMVLLKYVLKLNDDLMKILQEKRPEYLILCGVYTSKSSIFQNLFRNCEQILHLNSSLDAAYLNR